MSLVAVVAFRRLGCGSDKAARRRIRKEYERLIYSVKGPDLYRAHCAACHGADGKGDGPLAPALKTKPADLTVLSRNNGGKFPADRVRKFISGDEVSALPWLTRNAGLGPDLPSDRGRPGFRQRPFAESGEVPGIHAAEIVCAMQYAICHESVSQQAPQISVSPLHEACESHMLLGTGVRRHGFGSIGRRGADTLDDHVLDVHGSEGHIARIARHARDRFHHVRIFALSPDRVFSVEAMDTPPAVMKKCVSLVSGPLLAMARRPGASNLSDGVISLLYGKPGPSGCPTPVPSTSPPWIMDSGNDAVNIRPSKNLVRIVCFVSGCTYETFPSRQAHHGAHGHRALPPHIVCRKCFPCRFPSSSRGRACAYRPAKRREPAASQQQARRTTEEYRMHERARSASQRLFVRLMFS